MKGGEVGEEVGRAPGGSREACPCGQIRGQEGRERGRLEVKPSSSLVLRSMFFLASPVFWPSGL